jgi:hypothetical protein
MKDIGPVDLGTTSTQSPDAAESPGMRFDERENRWFFVTPTESFINQSAVLKASLAAGGMHNLCECTLLSSIERGKLVGDDPYSSEENTTSTSTTESTVSSLSTTSLESLNSSVLIVGGRMSYGGSTQYTRQFL